MTRSTPTPASMVIRVTLAVVGAVGLLIGTIAVFRSANQAGAVVLLIGGLLFVLAAIAFPSSGSTTWFAGWGRRAGTDTVAALLRSPSPQVRLATAEAVLGPQAHSDRHHSSAELRELALDVLLNRDLIRRLADLLRRGGYSVIAADMVDAALGDPTASVVVRLDRPGDAVQNPVQIPILVSNDATVDVPRTVAALSIAAGRFDTRSAIAVFAGQSAGPVPLSSVTSVGEIRVFAVYSPRLRDEQSVLAAVAQAVEVAGSTSSPAANPRIASGSTAMSASPTQVASPNGASANGTAPLAGDPETVEEHHSS
jgi:hypothetical protein